MPDQPLVHESDTDYLMKLGPKESESLWITVGDISIYIYNRSADGKLFVTLSPRNCEDIEGGADLASCSAYQADAIKYQESFNSTATEE